MQLAQRLAATVTCVALGLGLAGAAPVLAGRDTRGADFTPGAPGIGDPYYPRYGNGGYDVRSYDIRNSYAVGTGRLVGRTRLTAVATKDLSRFNLDLLLRATEVRVDGRSARFEQTAAQELVVTPDRGLRAGTRFKVLVRHQGRPARLEGAGGVDAWLRTNDGAIAVGEPEIAAWWFAGNDHPRDRARFDVTVLVPRGTQAISNGRLASHRRVGDRTRWRWHVGKPMTTYLAFMAIGRYDIQRGRSSGRSHLYAYSKTLGDRVARVARRSIRQSPDIVDFLDNKFGRYPFGQVGGVVPTGRLSFALENQTRPVYSRFFFDDGTNPFVVAHELAHQWYGDAVSIQSWRDIWLNEGFASYAEYLFVAKRFELSAQRQFLRDYRSFKSDRRFWNVPVANPGARNQFDIAVYVRGAMTLQALRNKLGTDDFLRLLKRWAKKPTSASTREFIRRAERVKGGQLDRFFDVWLYQRSRPARTVANGFPPRSRLAPVAPEEARRQERVLDLAAAARRQIAAAENGR